jgi:signal peptidase I
MEEDVRPEPASAGKKKNSRSRKRAVIAIVLLILVAASLALFYNLNGNSLDPRDREIRLIVTDSMEGEKMNYDIPTIEKDSLVMVKFVSGSEKKDIQVGDVIQFRYHGILNHHRVIENDTDGGFVITKGDNSDGTEKVLYENIRGEVVGKNHVLGEVFKFVKDYLYVLIAFFIVLYIGILLLEEIRKEKEEKQ